MEQIKLRWICEKTTLKHGAHHIRITKIFGSKQNQINITVIIQFYSSLVST